MHMSIWLKQLLFHTTTWAKKPPLNVYPFASPLCLSLSLCCCTLSIVHLTSIYSLYPCQGLMEQHFYLSWVCFEGWFTLGTLLVACLGGIVIQISWSTCYSDISCFCFSRGKNVEKKKKEKKRKGVNKVIGMGLWSWDCLIPPLRFLWCEVVILALVAEVFFAC